MLAVSTFSLTRPNRHPQLLKTSEPRGWSAASQTLPIDPSFAAVMDRKRYYVFLTPLGRIRWAEPYLVAIARPANLVVGVAAVNGVPQPRSPLPS
jgi:hypothetical protein